MNEKEHINDLYNKLIISTDIFFPKVGKVNITTNHGVYIIFDPHGKVLHVGKTNRGKAGLNQRLQNHLYNSSSFSVEYLKKKWNKLRNGYYFKCIIESDPRSRSLLEALAIGKLCPAHIGTGE